MTQSPTFGSPPANEAVLPNELIDGIGEAVASPGDSFARSAAIYQIVLEIFRTMEWVHCADGQDEELSSLRGLVAEAQAHQVRMGRGRLRSVSSPS
jgi:hypothetical protein